MGGFGFLLITMMVLAGQTQAGTYPDNQGLEFIVGYMQNYQETEQVELFVTTSNDGVSVSITAPMYPSIGLNEQFTISAGEVQRVKIDNSIRAMNTSLETKGILVTASAEVVVYGANVERLSNDAFMCYPVDVMGTDYYTVGYYPSYLESEFLIIGITDTTSVTVTLGSHAEIVVEYDGVTYYNGDVISLTMDRFDTLQLQTMGDLTGSFITADKNIVVYSGNIRTEVQGNSLDHIVEQLMPVITWGKEFATVPIPERLIYAQGDLYKFVGSENDTSVSVLCSGGHSLSFTLGTGTYTEHMFPADECCHIISTKAIMVAIIVLSQYPGAKDEQGDPSLIIVPPMEQYAADYTFSTPKYSREPYNGVLFRSFMLFIVKDSEKSGLRIDGSTLPSDTAYTSIPDTSYVGGYFEVSDGTHSLYHTSPISVFGVFMYGAANWETYGMPAGLRLSAINQVCIVSTGPAYGDGVDNDCDGLIDEEICTDGVDDDGDGTADEDCTGSVPADVTPVDGNWAAWGEWSSCSVSCSPSTGNYLAGIHSRNRTCTDPAPEAFGDDCEGDAVESSSCTISSYCVTHGGWSNWTSWSSCSQSCGIPGGSSTRTRTCDSPAPANGGDDCSGDTSESIVCNEVNCPVDGGWGSWSAWGGCTLTCGGGTTDRTRACDSPAVAYNGTDCSGDSSESATCNDFSCPVDGGWGSWSAWSSCTVSCGIDGGTSERTRACDSPAMAHGGTDCSGDASETTTCNAFNCPVDGGWGSWSAWGSCTLTCGVPGGDSVRSRACDSPAVAYGGADCGGDGTEAVTCNEFYCQVDGAWGTWSDWSTCSVSCGIDGGTSTRTRACDSPAMAHGGLDCTGDTEESVICNTFHCPIDGAWAAWSAWSTCGVTCGDSTISRNRSCTDPAPQYNGTDCLGSATEESSCFAGIMCPIDGGYTSWTDWDSCTATCAGGTQNRTRDCTNPTPQYLGADCVGDSEEQRDCNTQNCPIDGAWGSWSSWSSCSLTCGVPGGASVRTRNCDSPSAQYGGNDCSGDGSESLVCNEFYCPIDGNFTTWSSWDTCTASCLGGTQNRTRSCTNPAPQYNGTDCTGDTEEQQACNTQNCPIDGGWSEWSEWGFCSNTCGPGTYTREHTCTNPTPQYDGADCIGSTSETADCNGTCTVHGGWGSWGNWSFCSQSCDGGRQGRVRVCDSPAPTPEGNPCYGDAFDFQTCNEHPCSEAQIYNGTYINLCPRRYFTCFSGITACIPQEQRCDCNWDCEDGSDETANWAWCSEYTIFYCESNNTNGISPSLLLYLSVSLLTFAVWIINS